MPPTLDLSIQAAYNFRRDILMPVIARFYGILIKMYFREHGKPHFHAIYKSDLRDMWHTQEFRKLPGLE